MTQSLAPGVHVIARGKLGTLRHDWGYGTWNVECADGTMMIVGRRECAAIPSQALAPTPDEIAACPVLAEVAGKTEREAVLMLAKEVALHRQAAPEKIQPILDKFVAKVGVVGPMPKRPRVGPWVDTMSGARRFDAMGHEVGWVNSSATWGAHRPFDQIAIGVALNPEAAKGKVDAILGEWADLDQ